MPPILRIGGFVRTRRGLGKVKAVEGNLADIQFFHSVAGVKTLQFPVDEVRATTLEQQTRCYVNIGPKHWKMGRIGSFDNGAYEVNFPDSESKYIRENSIFVRWNLPIDNPMELLVLKGQETAYFQRKRSGFVEEIYGQRAVSRGMPGLISAQIELYAHQVEVARRVLADPIQRYLLADEVGLGKTIEAGIIIRQTLLDNPGSTILVVTPPFIKEQWAKELELKFLLNQRARVVIVGTDEMEKVNTSKKYALVVLDEAHHIAGKAFSPLERDQDEYNIFRYLCHNTQRVLLLSATPVLNNEPDFLAMLHLLDPDNYNLNEIDQFREKVNKRQEIGRLLLSFNEGAREFVLKMTIKKLVTIFPNDSLLADLVGQLGVAIEGGNTDREKVDQLIRIIRLHISETYRLHRRMLRNRRESVDSNLLQARYLEGGPDNQLTLEYDLDDRSEVIHQLLEEWRVAAYSSIISCDSTDACEYREKVTNIFLALVQSMGCSLNLCREVVSHRLTGENVTALAQDFDGEIIELLSSLPYIDGEREILEQVISNIDQTCSEGDKIDLLKQLIRQYMSRRKRNEELKCLIFCTFPTVCQQTLQELTNSLGIAKVAGYCTAFSPEKIEEEVEKFRKNDDCIVMVADKSGEEGRNFQFANVLIHYDLPWEPNRLEQRIGRVDRIGRFNSLRSHVMVGPEVEDSIFEAWYGVLSEGFGIFHNSIASLQFFVDEKIPVLIARAMDEGASGLTALKEEISDARVQEGLLISEQNTLDEIDVQDVSTKYFFSQLLEYEANHGQIHEHFENWIVDGLGFQKSIRDVKNQVVQYSPTRRTLVPMSRLLTVKETLERAGTFRRSTSLEVRNCNLFRIGDPFVDFLEKYIRWDDRGQAFAIWRLQPGWDTCEGGEWTGFRMDYVVEASMQSLQELAKLGKLPLVDQQALKRRADAYFQPLFRTIFMDTDCRLVTDTELLSVLNRKFNNYNDRGCDINLTKQSKQYLDQLIDPLQWPQICRDVRKKSEECLINMPEFVEMCQERFKAAERDLRRRLEQISLRKNQEACITMVSHDLELEELIAEGLLKGILKPKVRLDSVGFIAVSGRNPLKPDGRCGN